MGHDGRYINAAVQYQLGSSYWGMAALLQAQAAEGACAAACWRADPGLCVGAGGGGALPAGALLALVAAPEPEGV